MIAFFVSFDAADKNLNEKNGPTSKQLTMTTTTTNVHTSPSSNTNSSPSSSSPVQDQTDQIQAESAQTASQHSDEPETDHDHDQEQDQDQDQDRLDELHSPPKQVRASNAFTQIHKHFKCHKFDANLQPLPEFNDNNSEENHRTEPESSAIENHTSTDNSDESPKLPATSVSLKKVTNIHN